MTFWNILYIFQRKSSLHILWESSAEAYTIHFLKKSSLDILCESSTEADD